MKSNFYCSFNSVFHRVARFQNEIVVLQLVTSFCQPHLLYCTECLGLSVTHLRSIEHTWQCAISHIFHISGSDVARICDFTGKLYDIIGVFSCLTTVSFSLWLLYSVRVWWTLQQYYLFLSSSLQAFYCSCIVLLLCVYSVFCLSVVCCHMLTNKRFTYNRDTITVECS